MSKNRIEIQLKSNPEKEITFKIFVISCTNRCSDVISSRIAIFLGVKLNRFFKISHLFFSSLFVVSTMAFSSLIND